MFEPVKNQRVSDEILQQIREAVLTGKFQIGDRLPNERTLAEHSAILDAIEMGDAEAARAWMTAHIAGVESWLRKAAP